CTRGPQRRPPEGRGSVRVRPRRRGGGDAGRRRSPVRGGPGSDRGGGGAVAGPVRGGPGVAGGVAAPAYAGIPVTHREDASAVAFVAGHEDPSKDGSSIDWDALARFRGTLVLYMSGKRLPA